MGAVTTEDLTFYRHQLEITAPKVREAVERAVRRSTELLGFSDGRVLGPSEMSVALRCLAVDAIEKELGPLAELRARLTEEMRARAAAIARRSVTSTALEALADHPRIALPRGWLVHCLSDERRSRREEFLRRVSETAIERVASETAAPELCIAMDPVGRGDWLPGRVNLGVVFVEGCGFTSELHTLVVDASDGNVGSDGRPLLNVIGVRGDWLGPGNVARRAIFEDGHGGLLESELSPPLPLDGALFLCLGPDERERHRELANSLAGCFLANPHAAAAQSEDKFVTHVRLRARGVKTPPCMLIEPKSEGPAIARSLDAFVVETGRRRLVVQPRFGTEGSGVMDFEWSRARASEVLERIGWLQKLHGDLIVRPLVGNVRFGSPPASADLRVNVAWNGTDFVAESGYLQVAGDPAEVAASVGRGGRIVKLSDGALEGLALTNGDLDAALREAVKAAACLEADAGDGCCLMGVDVKIERTAGEITPWVLDVNPRPSGLGYSELIDTREPGTTRHLWPHVVRRCAVAQAMRILREDSDERPEDILFAADSRSLVEAVHEIRRFLRKDTAPADARIHLLQERAILVLAAILWRMREIGMLPAKGELEAILADVSASEGTRAQILDVIEDVSLSDAGEDGYLIYMNQFLSAVNEREMLDFRLARESLLSQMPWRPSESLRLKDASKSYRATSPMRVGISSANASDNWTFSKLRGGVVLNFAVDLADKEGSPPEPPVSATLEPLDHPVLIIETVSRLETDRPNCAVITADNAEDFFAVPPGAPFLPETCFKDIKDPLLLLKYSLVFARIIGYRENPGAYAAEPARVLHDVARFTGQRGLRLVVRSSGPSRSGFASSSCVALCLLRALYGASQQDELAQPATLSSLALLLENEVGLKSGKQDTDGPLYPSVKSIKYPPATGFLESDLTVLEVDEVMLRENLVLVNSGIQRPAATGLRRGLNMRHYAYVSRDPKRFAAVVKSLEVHERIVDAVRREDWPSLGTLFTEYLDLRERIDPGATQSVYDEAAGRKVLRYPFEHLLAEGLIHGGMYAGAMGGGCLMLVPTPRGKETVTGGATRLFTAIESLRSASLGGEQPFARLHVYDYAINTRGLEYLELPG